jgi:two-component system phosphate regulon sensor histidine kinase PhoR
MLIWLLLSLSFGLVVGIWLGINLNLNVLKGLGLGLDHPQQNPPGVIGKSQPRHNTKGNSKNNSKTNSKPNPKTHPKSIGKNQVKKSLRQRLIHGGGGTSSDQRWSHRLILSLRRHSVGHKSGQLGPNLLNVWHQAPIGYLQVDAENHLIWCNQAAANLLGIANYQSGITKGQFLLQLVRSYELDQLIENTRHQGQPTAQDWVWHPLVTDPLAPVMRGQKITLRGLGFPLEDGHIGIFLENRQEVITLIEQRDRWIADVTHELKTPLTAIRLVGELLETRLDPTLQPWIGRLLGEVNRLSELVQDVLELARLSADSEPALLRYTETDLVSLIHQSWESLNLISEKRQIPLDYHGPDHCLITIDTQCIERLLTNLLDNSIKHSPTHQPITVKLTKLKTDSAVTSAPVSEKIEDIADDHHLQSGELVPCAPEPSPDYDSVLLEIIDHGSGFNPVDLPHIFKRFYCGDQSRKRTESGAGGSGLGLAIVKQIVQLHCGDITINNHPKTGGAWVKILLPISAAPALAPASSSASSHPPVSNS